MNDLDIRLAHPEDRLNLIELQRRASLVYEDTRQQLLDNPDVIDLDEEMLANNEVFVAELAGRIVGFATIIAHEGNDAEIEGLFVEPSEWRSGIGRALVHQLEVEAVAWGASRLHVLANRNALGFYEAVGFTIIGEQKTELGPTGLLMAKAVVPR
jgi:N-acetylglutamate synthase-like GNAT family acetyltransferase